VAEFKPYLKKASGSPSTYYLPQPINTMPLSIPFNMDEHLMPVSTGGITYGHYQGLLTITIEGDLYKDTSDSSIIGVENTSLDEFEAMRAFIAGASRSNTMKLVIYNDGAGVYRWYDKCFPKSLNTDLGDNTQDHRFPYTLQLVCEDPVLKTTSP
jgi:hypothetical protein